MGHWRVAIKGQHHSICQYDDHDKGPKNIAVGNLVEESWNLPSVVRKFSHVGHRRTEDNLLPNTLVQGFHALARLFTQGDIVLSDYEFNERSRKLALKPKKTELILVSRTVVRLVQLLVLHQHNCNCQIK